MMLVIGCIVGTVGAHWFMDGSGWAVHAAPQVYGILSLYLGQIITGWFEL